MSSQPIRVHVWFGHIEPELRHVWVGRETLECQGRSKYFDRSGACVRVTEWEPISRMTWPAEPPAEPQAHVVGIARRALGCLKDWAKRIRGARA